MHESSSTLQVLTSLRLGERVLVRSDDGFLAAEYALFEGTDIVLRATDPVSVREAGYMTAARDALARLERFGVTPGLAEHAANALPSAVAAAYAWGSPARGLVKQLGAYELFDGAAFMASAHRYEGAWLNLGLLSAAVPMAGASILIQALYLATALSEVAPTTPVHLSTASAMRGRRPSERTHAKVDLAAASELPGMLAKLPVPAEPVRVELTKERRVRQALLARVRDRIGADSSPKLKAHVASLEVALANRTMQIGPLADPTLQSIERRLASGDARGVKELLDEIERNGGTGPGVRYLRARAALLQGEESPQSVARVLSDLAKQNEEFHEAAVAAARSWLAAGEPAHARFFARKVVANPAIPDRERLVAFEILDETSSTGRSNAPPPDSYDTAPAQSTALMSLRSPSMGDVSPAGDLPRVSSIPPGPEGQSGASDPYAEREPAVAAEPYAAVVVRYEPELAESLPLPFGASESALGMNATPRTPLQARITMTRLTRDLARDYRLWYGKSLRCNVLAIDAMQQHLSHRFVGAPISDPGVAWELRRHGALLSEILARTLGAAWVDVRPSEPGYWAMQITPTIRSWPIGRVYRYVALGHREKDLVSYYLDLEGRARKPER